MADEAKPTNTGTSDSLEAPKRKRRVLRPAAEVATLREKSEQAQAKSSQPHRLSRPGRVAGSPFRLLGRIFRPLGRFRLFRAIGYVLFPPYFRNSWHELKQVSWPDRLQTRRLVFAVIIFSLTFGTIVAGVDWGLDRAFRALVLDN